MLFLGWSHGVFGMAIPTPLLLLEKSREELAGHEVLREQQEQGIAAAAD